MKYADPMKASETTLRSLLEGTKQFQIPLFQRPYSWEKENWEALWTDLISLYTGEVEGCYFLGPIVTQAVAGTADGISPFIVIDGQQRLTTLTIILAVLRNLLNNSDPEIAQEVSELYLINKFKKNDDYYKVLPTQDDREVYKSLIKSVKVKDIKKSGNIYETYKFFDNKFKKPDPDEEILMDYAKFKVILLERLVLVNITSDDGDNPYLIFESLNNKGKALTQADLVRNYIFMQLPREEQDEVYQQEWLPCQEKFKENLKHKDYSDELTTAFWFYLRKDGFSINQKEVYKTIKKRIDDSPQNIKAELKNLIQFAGYYQRFNFPEQEKNTTLRRRFERLKRLDFSTCQMFLLNIYDCYKNESLSLDKFEAILNYLESYFIRRWVVGESTRALSKFFDGLYKKVKENNSEDLVIGLRDVLLSTHDKTPVFPDDESFKQGLINKPLYKTNMSDRVKLMLERIEGYLTKELVDFGNLTDEHIMPQNFRKEKKEWEIMLGDHHKNVHKKWLHTLGNLTLTAKNPELSNKPFEEKVKILRESNLSLNHYFRNIDIWNEDAIQKRAESLANIAIKIWVR
jgi:uncharacterized protein with ParB-like and HNH nuclease domain